MSRVSSVVATSLSVFANDVWTMYDSSKATKAVWARDHTLKYLREVSRSKSFLEVYTKIIKASPVVAVAPVAVAAVFAENGSLTDAEKRLAKNQLNAFLFNEYDTWFHAFEAEADEDDSNGSAEDLWTYETSKKLSKRTGISSESLQPIVSAWLTYKSV